MVHLLYYSVSPPLHLFVLYSTIELISQMDNYGADNEFNRLISELTQGRDLVQQLQLHLNAPNYNSSSSSPENTREFLLHNIQSKFDRALSLLQYNSTGDNSNSLLPHSNSPAIPIFGTSDSPRSSPPHSEDSDRDLEPKDHHATRKRFIVFSSYIYVCVCNVCINGLNFHV